MKKKKGNRLVVGDASWADTIPEWILNEVQMERTITAAIDLAGKKKLSENEQVGDAEVVAYLCPATMAHPMDRDYVDIYIYLCSKLMIKAKRATENSLPEDFKESLRKGLSNYQETLLGNLRHKIFTARGKVSHPVFDALKEVFKETKMEEGRKNTQNKSK